MSDLKDLLDLIRAWREYRMMLTIVQDEAARATYQRLVDDYALVIRRRLGR